MLLIGAAVHPNIALPGQAIDTAAKAGKVKCQHVTAQPAKKWIATKAWPLIRWDRGRPRPIVIAAYKRKLKCARSTTHRASIRRSWKAAKREFREHRKRQLRERRIAALTPHDGCAIPAYIVMCESRGDFRAYNAGYEPHGPGSGPGGAYQIIASTWAAYGGLEFAPVASQASEEAQHIVAGRIYAAEGSGPWECA